jgi:hypothetical protein
MQLDRCLGLGLGLHSSGCGSVSAAATAATSQHEVKQPLALPCAQPLQPQPLQRAHPAPPAQPRLAAAAAARVINSPAATHLREDLTRWGGLAQHQPPHGRRATPRPAQHQRPRRPRRREGPIPAP